MELIGADRAHVFIVGCNSQSFFEAFGLFHVDRYRPLSVWLEGMLTCLRKGESGVNAAITITLMAFLHACLITLLFWIGRSLSAKLFCAGLGIWLFGFSNAIIVSNLSNLFSAFEIAPELTIVGCFFGYLLFHSGKTRVGAGLFVICAIIGPWFREVAIIGPLSILVLEILALPKRKTLLLYFSGLLTLHALIPTAIPAILEGQVGGLRTFLHGQEIGSQFQSTLINWWRTGRILNQIPGIIWIIIIFSVSVFISRSYQIFFSIKRLFNSVLHNAYPKQINLPPINQGVAFFSIFCSVVLLSPLFFQVKTPEASSILELRWEWLPIIWFGLFLLVSAVKFGPILPVWVLINYLPLLHQPNNYESHLPFITAPLCLLSAFWVFALFDQSMLQKPLIAWKRVFTLLLVALGVIFQGHNYVKSIVTTKTLIKANNEIAQWLKTTLLRGSVLFVNSFPAFEIFDRAGRVHDFRWIVRAGPLTHIPGHGALVSLEEQISYIRKRIKPTEALYYLLVTSDNGSGPYTLLTSNNTLLMEWKIKIPVRSLDPIRNALHKPTYMQVFTPFQWRPTFEQFLATVSQDFTIVKIQLFKHPASPNSVFRDNILKSKTATKPQRMKELQHPQLIIDGYRNTSYNVIYYRGKFYGLHRSDGAFDINKIVNKFYTYPVIIGNSLEQVKSQFDQIDKGVSTQKQTGRFKRPHNILKLKTATKPQRMKELQHPQLIIDGYRNTSYNVIYYRGKFYGLYRGDGAFDINKIVNKFYTYPVITGNSLEQVKKELRKIKIPKESN